MKTMFGFRGAGGGFVFCPDAVKVVPAMLNQIGLRVNRSSFALMTKFKFGRAHALRPTKSQAWNGIPSMDAGRIAMLRIGNSLPICLV
jgi:hypothetical protein